MDSWGNRIGDKEPIEVHGWVSPTWTLSVHRTRCQQGHSFAEVRRLCRYSDFVFASIPSGFLPFILQRGRPPGAADCKLCADGVDEGLLPITKFVEKLSLVVAKTVEVCYLRLYRQWRHRDGQLLKVRLRDERDVSTSHDRLQGRQRGGAVEEPARYSGRMRSRSNRRM